MNNQIEHTLNKLLAYGYKTQLLDPLDGDYVTNRLRDLLKIGDFTYKDIDIGDTSIQDILNDFLSYAIDINLIEDTIDDRDILDTKIMDCITPYPKEVINNFKIGGTDYFYKLSKDSNYIRVDRIAKDKKWHVNTIYGDLEITINLSKPEKDPKTIAMARELPITNYPPCLICKEHVGNTGTAKNPARNNHRIIPLSLNDENWFFQYSPYVYYNEHCIVIKEEHVPMEISHLTFKRLIDFISMPHFSHYFIGSNTDLPIVGGSILDHEHFQGGKHMFAMNTAEVIRTISLEETYKGVSVDILKWPLTTMRLRYKGDNPKILANVADVVLQKWRNYSDPQRGIISHTGDTPHNTVTPIARINKNSGYYELDIVLRNNRTNEQFPDGIYHAHPNLHHLKKENIGLIEVMGLAVLPGRLVSELDLLKNALLKKGIKSMENTPADKHISWAKEITDKYADINENNADKIIQTEIGNKFVEILECCGVYKLTKDGIQGLEEFIKTL